MQPIQLLFQNDGEPVVAPRPAPPRDLEEVDARIAESKQRQAAEEADIKARREREREPLERARAMMERAAAEERQRAALAERMQGHEQNAAELVQYVPAQLISRLEATYPSTYETALATCRRLFLWTILPVLMVLLAVATVLLVGVDPQQVAVLADHHAQVHAALREYAKTHGVV